MKNLQNYLRDNYERGVIDHALRATAKPDGTVEFYIHPAGSNGDTLDFAVQENTLITKNALICGTHAVFSRPECIFRYCPNPARCASSCATAE